MTTSTGREVTVTCGACGTREEWPEETAQNVCAACFRDLLRIMAGEHPVVSDGLAAAIAAMMQGTFEMRR